MNPMLWKLDPTFRILAPLLGLATVGIQFSDVPFPGSERWTGLALGAALAGVGAWNLWQFRFSQDPLE